MSDNNDSSYLFSADHLEQHKSKILNNYNDYNNKLNLKYVMLSSRIDVI